MYSIDVMLDLNIYLDSSFNLYGDSCRIIEELKNSDSRRHVLLISVEEEFYRVYHKLETKVRFEITKLARIDNEYDFHEKLTHTKKMRNGQILNYLECVFDGDLFSNRKKMFRLYNVACKKLHQDFYNCTYNCLRYDNNVIKVDSEIEWIKNNFVDFQESEHYSDTQHLAGAIQYNQTNKIFISEDKIFKQFEVIKIHKEKLDAHNLNVYSPGKYIELGL